MFLFSILKVEIVVASTVLRLVLTIGKDVLNGGGTKYSLPTANFTIQSKQTVVTSFPNPVGLVRKNPCTCGWLMPLPCGIVVCRRIDGS